MSEARINGKPASLAAAAERAAEILSQARLPVIAGLGTDVAGARASILLAEKLRGAYDHMHSARIFADLDVMRQAGLMFTTPSEARLRADVLLFVGKDLTKIWPELMARLSPGRNPALRSCPSAAQSLVGCTGTRRREGRRAPDRNAGHFGSTWGARGLARPCCRAGGE